jgi:hypothetical protein
MADQKYLDWIAANIAKAYGECAEATDRMAAAFPELTRVRGHYYCPIWGERAHWWLVAPDGSIVDPTASQFPSGGMGQYEAWDESRPEPTGMCPNCGGECFDGNYCCSESCGRAYAAYCMNPHSY